MRHSSNPVSYRRHGTGNPSRRPRYVLAGQKDFYDPANPGDLAEYRTVLGYRHR